MRVSYLDDEQDEGDGYTSNTSGRKMVYAGQVVDCNLEQMALRRGDLEEEQLLQACTTPKAAPRPVRCTERRPLCSRSHRP